MHCVASLQRVQTAGIESIRHSYCHLNQNLAYNLSEFPFCAYKMCIMYLCLFSTVFYLYFYAKGRKVKSSLNAP